MSQENVEVVRDAFLATAGGDPVAAQGYFDEAIEWDMSGVVGWLEEPVYRGDEVPRFLRGWATSWGGTWRFDLDDVRDAAGDQVFAAIHEWGTGADSRARVDQRRYFAVTLRERRLVRVQMFSDRADALKAVGLEE